MVIKRKHFVRQVQDVTWEYCCDRLHNAVHGIPHDRNDGVTRVEPGIYWHPHAHGFCMNGLGREFGMIHFCPFCGSKLDIQDVTIATAGV